MLTIREDKNKTDVKLFLAYNADYPKSVCLMAEDADGDEWFILNVSPAGVELSMNVPDEVGITEDSGGYVVVSKEK